MNVKCVHCLSATEAFHNVLEHIIHKLPAKRPHSSLDDSNSRWNVFPQNKGAAALLPLSLLYFIPECSVI